MGRRPRTWQSSDPPRIHCYSLGSIFIAGLVCVDAFNLHVGLNVPSKHLHHHARASSRASYSRRQGCRTCRVVPLRSMSTSSDGCSFLASSSSRRTLTPSDDTIGPIRNPPRCVTSSETKRSAERARLPRAAAAPSSSSQAQARSKHVGVSSSSPNGVRRADRSHGSIRKTSGLTTEGMHGQPQQKQQQKKQPRSWDEHSPLTNDAPMSRRQLVNAFTAMGAAAVLVGGSGFAIAAPEADEELEDMLVWSPKAEILKRAQATGGGMAPGANDTYPIRFVTYLARLLLNYDKASRELWEQRAKSIPINFSTMEVEAVRKDQFAEFAKAVQVGLLDYQGPQGIKAFFSLMRSRYGQGDDCKRQLAILFSFLKEGQPTEQIEGLLGEIDNGHVSSLVVTDPGGGYTGKIPKVTVSRSQAGKQVKARAVLKETGHLIGIRLPECDISDTYKTPPTVRVSPPADPRGVQAKAQAVLDRKGILTAIEITNSGSGYSSTLEPVTVEVFGAENAEESGDLLVESVLGTGGLGETACSSNFVAEAIIDREVGSIEVLDSGDGYATSVPFVVDIQSPTECEGRPDGMTAYAVGLIAPGLSRDSAINKKLPVPPTSLTSKLAQMLPSTVADTLYINESGRYESLDLSDLPGMLEPKKGKGASTMFDPIFGPVGRSPLEKESLLGINDYVKLATAGAACNALVRFALHPLDCVKTTVQAEMGRDMTDEEKEEGAELGWAGTIKGILKKGGVRELSRGLDVSTILGFVLGFIGFGGTEFFRRELTRMMEGGSSANSVWIILLASALAQLVSCVVTCPVEAVRIRVMTCDKRPEFFSFVGTAQEMLEEKGIAYFWSGLGALLFRELPFAIAKFLTFELVRDKIFAEVPAAQESVFYALVVSIVAGMVAGVAGAIVSQPADTVLTRLNTTVKKASPPPTPQIATPPRVRRPWDLKPSVAGAVGVRAGGNGVFGGGGGMGSRRALGLMEVEVEEAEEEDEEGGGMDWKDVVREMFEGEGGVMNLFSGLGLRAIFFGAAIALQFFAFDYFKALLKVAPDDLKLVLDVFADRVSFYANTAQDLL